MGINAITFGKNRYHEHLDMEQWCTENIGTGGWTSGTPKTWEGLGDKIWIIHSTFGKTTFVFKEAKHLTMFMLRWA